MRDIYLIDFENVASEGLSGITYLSEDDQVIIFYSNNSNRLTMKMHILIGKSVCNLTYFEVTVGGKNALDHQISTFLGYLIGTEAAQRNYYIVSRDMGYKHVANFWAAKKIGPKVRCIDTIKGASRLERNRREPVLQPVPQEADMQLPQETPAVPPEPVAEVPAPPESLEPVEAAAPEQPDAPVEIVEPEAALPIQETPPEPVPQVIPEAPVLPEPTMLEFQEPLEIQEPQPVQAPPLPEPVVAEPESMESEATEAQQKSQEPLQRRVNRNRPRSRGRYRKNYTAETPAAAEESPAPQTVEKPEPKTEAPEEKPEPLEKKPEQKKKPQKSRTAKQDAPVANLDQLASLIAPYPKLQENVLRDLIVNNKRQVLCNTLRKHLGQEKGLALYNEIKKCAWH